jgi:SAM-dependent methyltransferase
MFRPARPPANIRPSTPFQSQAPQEVELPAEIDSYSVSAKYYDAAYAAMGVIDDVRFYLELAKSHGGPVLEIGCGTGRVLVPIACSGIEIHGVDNSAPMLTVLKDKLARESSCVREKVTIHSGDMRDFRLGRKFPLVTIPFRPMQQLYTVEDQLAALNSAAAHLADGGTLAFDVFFPRFDRVPLGVGEERLEAEWVSPTDAEVLFRRFVRKEADDKVNQNYTVTFIFRSFRKGGLRLEETDTLKMSFYTYPHLRTLFLLAGLEIVEEYGSFAKTPMDHSAVEMIFLLRNARFR